MRDTPQNTPPDTPKGIPLHKMPGSHVSRDGAQSQQRMLLVIRLMYMVLLATIALLPFVGKVTDSSDVGFTDFTGAFIATFIFGGGVIVIDALTPNKKISSVFGIYLGVIAGLVGAYAVSQLFNLLINTWNLHSEPWTSYFLLAKLVLGITLCYMAISIVLTTKDEFRLVIPYVEFAKQVRGIRPMLLDTSALIDGRISDLSDTGFLDAPLVVPRFVLDELQALADSSDRGKRTRGRRGLAMVRHLQGTPRVDISLTEDDVPGHSVDHKLLRMGEDRNMRLVTTDSSLHQRASINGLVALNLHDLAHRLRPQAIIGDQVRIEINREGEEEGQGIGYLPDGSMVVVEDAADHVDSEIEVVVTNSLKTQAGYMVFARLHHAPRDHAGYTGTAHDRQPPSLPTSEPPSAPQGPSTHGRNPRRGSRG